MIGTDKLKVNHISAIRGTTLLKNQYPKPNFNTIKIESF